MAALSINIGIGKDAYNCEMWRGQHAIIWKNGKIWEIATSGRFFSIKDSATLQACRECIAEIPPKTAHSIGCGFTFFCMGFCQSKNFRMLFFLLAASRPSRPNLKSSDQHRIIIVANATVDFLLATIQVKNYILLWIIKSCYFSSICYYSTRPAKLSNKFLSMSTTWMGVYCKLSDLTEQWAFIKTFKSSCNHCQFRIYHTSKQIEA